MAMKEMLCLTIFQLKMNLANVSPRTIWRILMEVLKMPGRLAPKKPFLIKTKKEERIKWSKAELRKGKSK